MSTKNPTKLGCIPIDAVQSWRKVYCVCKEAHRTTTINEPYTKACIAYTDCGRISTITFLYDATAEVSTITTTADSSGSLCGTYFSLYSANDAKQYRPTFIVCCGSCLPASTSTIKYIAVNIQTNDHQDVTALALKNALTCNACALVDFTATVLNNIVTVTNNTNGTATNINDSGCTGFTFAVSTQGTQETAEVLTYTYDCFNRISSISNTSGTNILDMTNIISCSINRANEKHNNTVEVVTTSICACIPRKINLPECATSFIVYHNTCCKNLYYGANACITVSCYSAPLEQNERLNLSLSKGNDNNFYGIACSGTIKVYAVGVYKE